jgi:hypothetical protein
VRESGDKNLISVARESVRPNTRHTPSTHVSLFLVLEYARTRGTSRISLTSETRLEYARLPFDRQWSGS